MKHPRIALAVGLLMIVGTATSMPAQDTSTQQTATVQKTDEEKQKEKEAAEKRAVALLDQVVEQVQMLKLPENRIRVQIAAADLLWDRNEARARSLFSQAVEGVGELLRNMDSNAGGGRRNREGRTPAQLRQELVLTVAQHDATLAYQFLAATRSVTPATDAPNNQRPNVDANLEQNLLARVAALDPKLAFQKAEEALNKGQYPFTLAQVLAELQIKDKEMATKLAEKVTSKLQSANLLTTPEAGSLALMLLQAGPRQSDKPTDNGQANQPSPNQNVATTATPQVLNQSSYVSVMETVIDAALRATPQQQPTNNQRGPNGPRGRNFGPQNNNQNPPTDGQIEQQNARRMLMGLQMLLPQIDQYVPSRASAVRQKMTELGVGNNQRLAFNQLGNLMQQGTADSLLAAASTAPPPLQSRMYQQAALKALDEGNADRARQIANDHLDANTRDAVLQKVDFQLMAKKVEADKLDELRQTLAGLRNDDERIDLLVQLATASQKSDAKLALRLLGEAQHLTNRRAANYAQFEKQLAVSQAFADLEPARSFEVLDPGINQLNELLSAAALLSGFEVDIFKDGELPVQGGGDLGDMVRQYGEQLAMLARIDFERAQTSSNKFQLAEPRIMAQLAIARHVLGVPQVQAPANGFGGRGFNFNFNFARPPQ